ncbi:MAG: polysaccharide deacetylase family protein [Acidaminococcaceae bacterium]|nr:polysaccharide deacetylase family protein [Acidaminococcaceae bacterium]
MKKGKIILLVAIVGIIAGAAFFFHKTDPMKAQADHINFRDYSNEYQATEEIAVALKACENSEPALVIGKHKGEQTKNIALTFDGMADRGTMEGIVSTLQKYKFTGTFFLEGQNAARDANLVALIAKEGFTIGNYGFVGTAKEEKFTKDKLVSDLCKAQKALQITGGSKPTLFKLPQTVYDNSLLKAAKACGLDYAVVSTVFIPMDKIQNEADAEKFVAALQPGSIVSLRLGIPADIKQETGKTDDRPAIDKKPSLVLNNAKIDALGIVAVFDKVCAALAAKGYSVVPVLNFKDQAGQGQQIRTANIPSGNLVSEAVAWLGQQSRELFTMSTAYAAPKKKDLSAGVSDGYLANLKKANNNKLATEEKMLYTTERAVAFTFTGFSKPEGVNHILTALQKINGKGTFFVSERELQRNGPTIKKIADAGQELAISIYPKPEEDFNAVCRDILRTKQKLKSDYGVDTKLVKQFSGVVRDVTKEAALALNMR